MTTNYKENLIDIKAFIFDVDGVLTDGKLLISESGELLRSMNVKDGFAMKFAIDNGYKIGIISGGKSRRLNKKTYAGTKMTPLPMPKNPERSPAKIPKNTNPRKNSNM